MLYKPSLVKLFLAQQPTLLSKSSCIPVCPSSCRTTERGLESVAFTIQSSGPDHTPIHKCRIHTDPSRENKTMQGDLFQQLSERRTISLSMLHIQQMARSLCVSAQWHKRTTWVCACELITAFLCVFLLHSHADLGLPTLQSSEITQIHKATQGHYTESMGKFLTTSRVMGGVLGSWLVNHSQQSDKKNQKKKTLRRKSRNSHRIAPQTRPPTVSHILYVSIYDCHISTLQNSHNGTNKVVPIAFTDFLLTIPHCTFLNRKMTIMWHYTLVITQKDDGSYVSGISMIFCSKELICSKLLNVYQREVVNELTRNWFQTQQEFLQLIPKG